MIANQFNFDQLLIHAVISLGLFMKTVENSHFRRLMECLVDTKNIQMIGRTAAGNRMRGLYHLKWNNLLLDLSEQRKIFLTVDAWTSPNHIGFLSVKAYYICANWQVQKRLIEFKHIQKKHTDANFANIVLKILQNFNIQNQLLTIIADNAAINHIMQTSLKNDLNNIKIDWNVAANTIPCFAHIIQLVVKAFLTELNMKKSNAASEKDFNAVSNVKTNISFANIILKIVIYLDNLSWLFFWF